MIKMVFRYLRRFNDLSIRYKLLISYLLLIVVPLCLFLMANTFTASRDTLKQASYSARQILNQTKSYLEFKTTSTCNLLNYIALNDTVQEVLERDEKEYINSIGLWAVDAGKLTKVFYKAISNTDTSNVHLYMKHGLATIFENEDFMNLNKSENEKWFIELSQSNEIIKWFTRRYFVSDKEINYLYAVRNISNPQNIYDTIGVVKLDLPESVFITMLNQAIYTKSTTAILINGTDEVVCSSSTNHYKLKEIRDISLQMATDDYSDEVWKTLTLNHAKLLVGAQNINVSGWRLLLVIPYSDILGLSVKTRRNMILVFVAITLFTAPLAFLVAATATSRIKALIVQMRKVETGDLDAQVSPVNNDEIGELAKSFNYMLTQIQALLDEEYVLGKNVKNLELKALQAQINPHFLYNTLDLINWMSVRSNSPEISRVVEALSKFYKLSLSKGEDTVTIKNELEHVQTYVEIQNMRFENKIALVIDVPEELQEYMILKLVLQPIVENSIIHGILEKEGETGTIKISGALTDEVIRLYVEDDGVGMPEETALQLLTIITSHESHGYGVKNINERIKLYYGREYGLSYQSALGKGTILTITVPAVKKL